MGSVRSDTGFGSFPLTRQLFELRFGGSPFGLGHFQLHFWLLHFLFLGLHLFACFLKSNTSTGKVIMFWKRSLSAGHLESRDCTKMHQNATAAPTICTRDCSWWSPTALPNPKAFPGISVLTVASCSSSSIMDSLLKSSGSLETASTKSLSFRSSALKALSAFPRLLWQTVQGQISHRFYITQQIGNTYWTSQNIPAHQNHFYHFFVFHQNQI